MKEPNIVLRIQIPDDLLPEFLQHVRQFDAAHGDQCHFDIAINAPNWTTAEINTMLDNIKPPFAHRMTVRKS